MSFMDEVLDLATLMFKGYALIALGAAIFALVAFLVLIGIS